MLQQVVEFAFQRIERGAPCRRQLALIGRLVVNATLVELRGPVVARLQAHCFPPKKASIRKPYLSRVALNYLWITWGERLIRPVAFQ
ncbi:MAG: hypothetical protein Q8M24_00990 [Pseudolabrys sp.]|nr:hypothetical protein [Pseudolabrys sp.]MDP2294022.1 hypothetical protein [Pseudolabrys sp.]